MTGLYGYIIWYQVRSLGKNKEKKEKNTTLIPFPPKHTHKSAQRWAFKSRELSQILASVQEIFKSFDEHFSAMV